MLSNPKLLTFSPQQMPIIQQGMPIIHQGTMAQWEHAFPGTLNYVKNHFEVKWEWKKIPDPMETTLFFFA